MMGRTHLAFGAVAGVHLAASIPALGLPIMAAALLGWASVYGVIPAILFVLMIAYQGVRSGRSTYLVDMAPEDARSTYAALANTAIGVLLLVTGLIGGALSFVGPVAALLGFAVLSAAGGIMALRLREGERG